MSFYQYSFEKKGYAYFIAYRSSEQQIEFLFGPSDWDVEMILTTKKGKFAFKDLLKISSVAKWVEDNRYLQKDARNVKNELLWFIELLKVTLPILT